MLLDEVMAGLRPTETDRIVAILQGHQSRDAASTILLIEHVMRAVMALASQRARAAPRRRDRGRRAGGGRARSRGDAVLSRRGGGVMLTSKTSTCSTATPRRSTASRSTSRRAPSSPSSAPTAPARPRSSAPSPACTSPRAAASSIRGIDIAGWPSHKVCDLGIGQVAEGRQVFPTLSVCRESRHRRHAAARPRPRAQAIVERVYAPVSGACRAARGRRPARCRAASSRCSPSAAA